LERVVDGGDRFAAVELFRAFRIFNPSYAKTLSREDAAFALIEKLDHYPIFRRGGYVAKLKRGWNAYRQNASLVVADFGRSNDGKKDSSAILTWHYRMFLYSAHHRVFFRPLYKPSPRSQSGENPKELLVNLLTKIPPLFFGTIWSQIFF
jgi:hypothetical protein